MGKGDLFLPYFLYKFSKNTCILHFYVLQYNHSKEKGVIHMKLHFVGGAVADVEVQKQTKKYTTILCQANGRHYRVNNETGEVQENTYHKVIKGLCVEE